MLVHKASLSFQLLIEQRESGVTGTYLRLIAADAFLKPSDFLSENLLLRQKARPPRLKLDFLCFERGLNDGIPLLLSQSCGKLQLIRGVNFRFKPRRGGDEPVSLENKAPQLGFDRRVIKSNQRLVRFNNIAFLDQYLPNDPAFKMLNLLVLSRGNKRTRCNDGTGQRCRGCP